MNVRGWLRSFRYAYDGFLYALSTQKNMKFHFFAAFVALLLALLLELDKIEILFILLAVSLIIVTELINTALEKAVDLAMPDRHPVAKIAKDVAAASVLAASVFAVIVGFVVFFEPFDRWLSGVRGQHMTMNISSIWVIAILVLLSMMVLHVRFSLRRKRLRPSLISALSFSVASMIAAHSETLTILLAYSLSGLTALLLFEQTKRSLISICLGAIAGSVVTFGILFVL